MNYGWIIDIDHLSGPGAEFPDETLDSTGVLGPRDIEQGLQDRLAAGEGAKYQLFDDDGNLYYSGRLVRSDGEGFELVEGGEFFPGQLLVRASGSDIEWFGPLWDFGEPNAGAVTIKFEKDDKWGVL